MRSAATRDVSRTAAGSFALAGLLVCIAVYDLATGASGGAIVTSVGVVVTALFGVLAD